MKKFNTRLFAALCGIMLLSGCSKESSVYGIWSRDDDAVVMELHKDNTGMITADNIKLYKQKGLTLPSDILLKQEMKCKWSLSEGKLLRIDVVGADPPQVMNLRLEGNTLTRDGKVAYTKK